MGVAGRERLRRPEIRRMVEEAGHDGHGILRCMRQDNQLQIKWEESTSPACGGWEAQIKLEDSEIKPSKCCLLLFLGGKRWYGEHGHLPK